MQSRICLLSVSRGRPKLFNMAYHAALNKADNPDNIFIPLRVDFDDPHINEYKNILRSTDPFVVGASATASPSQLFQELYNQYTNYDIYFCMSDDTVCRTKSWDTKIINSFNSVKGKPTIAMRRVSDGVDRRKTLFFWTRGWIEALGYILPQGLSCCEDIYIAEIAESVAQKCGSITYSFLKNIVFEHTHYAHHKRDKDATDIMGDTRRIKNGNRQSYNTRKETMNTEVQLLVNAIRRSNGII